MGIDMGQAKTVERRMFQGITYDYTDAFVLVTGGSNGIGRAIAESYRDAGAHVVITGRRGSANEYEHDLSGMDYRQLELTDKKQIKTVMESIVQLDILINNAGGHQYIHESEWDPDGFDGAYAVNLSSVFHISHAGFEKLKVSNFPGGASLIAIASSSAYAGYEPAPGYSAAKAAMIQLVKTFAVSWGRYGIRANGVSPGSVETNLMVQYMDSAREQAAASPLGRIGQPKDIAPVVLFLTSPAASWITGQTLAVDGGFTISS